MRYSGIQVQEGSTSSGFDWQFPTFLYVPISRYCACASAETRHQVSSTSNHCHIESQNMNLSARNANSIVGCNPQSLNLVALAWWWTCKNTRVCCSQTIIHRSFQSLVSRNSRRIAYCILDGFDLLPICVYQQPGSAQGLWLDCDGPCVPCLWVVQVFLMWKVTHCDLAADDCRGPTSWGEVSFCKEGCRHVEVTADKLHNACEGIQGLQFPHSATSSGPTLIDVRLKRFKHSILGSRMYTLKPGQLYNALHEDLSQHARIHKHPSKIFCPKTALNGFKGPHGDKYMQPL